MRKFVEQKNGSSIPLVTVITVTYNLIKGKREKFIIQCLESVHNQRYSNIEHIVIDGASDDGTLPLLKKYESLGWIKLFSEPDTGIYDAMNKGILKANGKYVSILNSDDFFTIQKESQLVLSCWKIMKLIIPMRMLVFLRSRVENFSGKEICQSCLLESIIAIRPCWLKRKF